MTKGRKTTFDERVEIVEYCIAHDHNYVETSEKYGISYQQARSYTIKYENGGVEALQVYVPEDHPYSRKDPEAVKDQILIPFDAVYYDDDQAYVFVAEKGEESDKAVRRDVIAGAYNNDMITILEGLSEGDQVITTWGAGLKDGASIEIIHPQTGTQPDTQTDAQ